MTVATSQPGASAFVCGDGYDEIDDDDCWMCGGVGELSDTCTCGDDTCCCLNPEPEPCPECAT